MQISEEDEIMNYFVTMKDNEKFMRNKRNLNFISIECF